MKDELLKTKKPLWEVFPEFTERIIKDHSENYPEPGHDFMHTLSVAQIGEIIAPNRPIAILAWIAGMLHNTDKIFPEEEVKNKLVLHLISINEINKKISRLEKELIFEAVLQHSKKNEESDNEVTIILKDADRLGNAGIFVLMRTGQTGIPLFNPMLTPGATFKDVVTIRDSMGFTIEWQEMLRCPKAIEMGKRYFGSLQEKRDELEVTIKELGIDKFPRQLYYSKEAPRQ